MLKKIVPKKEHLMELQFFQKKMNPGNTIQNLEPWPITLSGNKIHMDFLVYNDPQKRR